MYCFPNITQFKSHMQRSDTRHLVGFRAQGVYAKKKKIVRPSRFSRKGIFIGSWRRLALYTLGAVFSQYRSNHLHLAVLKMELILPDTPWPLRAVSQTKSRERNSHYLYGGLLQLSVMAADWLSGLKPERKTKI